MIFYELPNPDDREIYHSDVQVMMLVELLTMLMMLLTPRLDVMNLQEQLDLKLQQRQARETGICQVCADHLTNRLHTVFSPKMIKLLHTIFFLCVSTNSDGR